MKADDPQSQTKAAHRSHGYCPAPRSNTHGPAALALCHVANRLHAQPGNAFELVCPAEVLSTGPSYVCLLC